MLKYLHEHECPWDKVTYWAAAVGGHLEVLKYAHENGCPGWNENLYQELCDIVESRLLSRNTNKVSKKQSICREKGGLQGNTPVREREHIINPSQYHTTESFPAACPLCVHFMKVICINYKVISKVVLVLCYRRFGPMVLYSRRMTGTLEGGIIPISVAIMVM